MPELRSLKFPEIQAQELYDSGLNDTQIANILDVPWQEVTRWRKGKGLQSNWWKNRKNPGQRNKRK